MVSQEHGHEAPDHQSLESKLLNEISLDEWPKLADLRVVEGARRNSTAIAAATRTPAADDGLNNNNNVTLDFERNDKPTKQRQLDMSSEHRGHSMANITHLMPSRVTSKSSQDMASNHLSRSSSTGSNKAPRSVDSFEHRDRKMIVDPTFADSTPSVAADHLFDTGGTRQMLQQATEAKQVKHDPDCALILKRTYILKGSASNRDEWGDKFVFNDNDPDDSKDTKRVHKSDLCIKHSDVDKAFQEAKHRIKFEKPHDLDSLDVGERSLASIGELNLATGLLLTKRFDLSPDEILNALPMIDVSASKHHWSDLCPKHVSPMVCMKSRYRTITGHCNNLKHPAWGASKTPYSRYLPPDYADGLSLPRASRTGQPLPSARLITSRIHVDADEPSHDYSILFADWGQLLNHDVTRVAVGEAPDCCPQLLKGLCMPIPVPEDDPLYSKFDVKCLKFERSLAAIRPKCLLGHRAQINLVTSPVDASFVYGSTKQQASRLRTFSEGKMKAWNYFDKHKLKPLLPPRVEEPDKDCLGRPKNLFCFEAGDVRVNEQTHLTVLHTVYLREHNRIAKQLAKINLEWDDERLYHETRHIIAAGVQHVMVNEFLPLLLGHKHIADYQFKPAANGGYWQGHDPRVTISTGTAFASAAFRYGHSMIEGTIRRMDPKSGALIKSELLRFLFKRPFMFYEPGAVDQLIAGMLLSPAEHTDPFVSEELSGHLFQPPKAKFGHDLAAINIQRGKCGGVLQVGACTYRVDCAIWARRICPPITSTRARIHTTRVTRGSLCAHAISNPSHDSIHSPTTNTHTHMHTHTHATKTNTHCKHADATRSRPRSARIQRLARVVRLQTGEIVLRPRTAPHESHRLAVFEDLQARRRH
jgi:peroxidase